MSRIDLRVYKKGLRAKMRALRQNMPEVLKKEKDRLIFEKIVRLPQYKKAKVLITYVSSQVEVDTRRLICRAFKDGKQVAVPRCIPNSREMQMHFISSMEDLAPGAYGILEPSPQAKVCGTGAGALCIVPAFCNDLKGYRLGYGGGYYDRYLSRFRGVKVGVNYSDCVIPALEHGRYDVPLHMLVTERKVHHIKPEKKAKHALVRGKGQGKKEKSRLAKARRQGAKTGR